MSDVDWIIHYVLLLQITKFDHRFKNKIVVQIWMRKNDYIQKSSFSITFFTLSEQNTSKLKKDKSCRSYSIRSLQVEEELKIAQLRTFPFFVKIDFWGAVLKSCLQNSIILCWFIKSDLFARSNFTKLMSKVLFREFQKMILQNLK